MRDKDKSRCADSGGAPYGWMEYAAPNGHRQYRNELEELLEDGCETLREYEMRVAEIEARNRLAMEGRLRGSEHLDPVRIEEARWELWEIRWTIDGRQFRQYHAEPPQHPRVLLALRAHWKHTVPPQSEITARQNAEMAEAGSRYEKSGFFPNGTSRHGHGR